jgi:tetratricopeptide (TPR) repeat protein
LVAEIALPSLDVRPPAATDTRAAARERAAPASASASPDASPRPPRKLRKRATIVADAGSAARAKLQLGDESLKQGRFFEALMAFREALDQDPPVPAAARRLGDAYVAHQDTDLAVAAYERYLELEPSAPDAEEVRAAVEQLRSSTPIAH